VVVALYCVRTSTYRSLNDLRGVFKKRTKPFKISQRLGLKSLNRHYARYVLAYSDSLRHFLIVKVVPLNVLDGESESMADTALGGVSNRRDFTGD
jgi:hypothetical protein